MNYQRLEREPDWWFNSWFVGDFKAAPKIGLVQQFPEWKSSSFQIEQLNWSEQHDLCCSNVSWIPCLPIMFINQVNQSYHVMRYSIDLGLFITSFSSCKNSFFFAVDDNQKKIQNFHIQCREYAQLVKNMLCTSHLTFWAQNCACFAGHSVTTIWVEDWTISAPFALFGHCEDHLKNLKSLPFLNPLQQLHNLLFSTASWSKPTLQSTLICLFSINFSRCFLKNFTSIS